MIRQSDTFCVTPIEQQSRRNSSLYSWWVLVVQRPYFLKKLPFESALVGVVEVHVGRGMVRVWQVLLTADRDDQAGTIRLHVPHGVVDRIGISKRRVEIIRTMDQGHVRVEHPILSFEDIHRILQIVKLVFDLLIVQRLFRVFVAWSLLEQVRIGGANSLNGCQP